MGEGPPFFNLVGDKMLNDYDDFLKEREQDRETMTVKEVKDLLNKYNDNTKVFITWESTVNSICKREFYIATTGSLYLDADGNYYKREFAKDYSENEE